MLFTPKIDTFDDLVKINEDIRKNVFGWGSDRVVKPDKSLTNVLLEKKF